MNIQSQSEAGSAADVDVNAEATHAKATNGEADKDPDIALIQSFYERSNADILCALDGAGAGILWTLPPRSPEALRSAVRQLRRAHATRVRWIRRLRLRSRCEGSLEKAVVEAVGIYVFPGPDQRVYRLDTGEKIPCLPFRDECLEVVVRGMAG